MRPKGSAEALEARRLIAGRLLLEGKGVREVSRLTNAASSSVTRWKKELGQGGLEALKAKPHPGRPPRLPPPGKAVSHLECHPRESQEEHFSPRHFYAAYIFDQAHERQGDVATLIEQAQQLGYPLRYWWLSEAVDLRGYPDRLIVCVHHPSLDEDAGMDLYEALKDQGVLWDALAAAVGEYCVFGKPVEGPGIINRPDGTPLFPLEAKGDS